MPQLDVLTYVAQFSWFLILFNLFYFFTLYQPLPKLFTILKARKKLTAEAPGEANNEIPGSTKSTAVSGPTNELLSQAVQASEQALRDTTTSSKAWVQATLVKLNTGASPLKGFNAAYLRTFALKQGKIYCFNYAAKGRRAKTSVQVKKSPSTPTTPSSGSSVTSSTPSLASTSKKSR